MKNSRINHRLFAAFFAVFLIVFDQVTKYLTRTQLSDGKSVAVIPGFLRFSYVKNDGVAFGQFSGLYNIIVPITVIVVIGCIVLIAINKIKAPVYVWGLSMIIGGAIGNMIDRIGMGFVTDMIDVYGIWNYVFNVADCGVVVGAAVIVIYEIVLAINQSKKGKSSGEN